VCVCVVYEYFSQTKLEKTDKNQSHSLSADSISVEDGSCLDPSTDIQIGGTVLLACSSNKCNTEAGGNTQSSRFGRLSRDDALALLFLGSRTKADRTMCCIYCKSSEPRTKSDFKLLEHVPPASYTSDPFGELIIIDHKNEALGRSMTLTSWPVTTCPMSSSLWKRPPLWMNMDETWSKMAEIPDEIGVMSRDTALPWPASSSFWVVGPQCADPPGNASAEECDAEHHDTLPVRWGARPISTHPSRGHLRLAFVCLHTTIVNIDFSAALNCFISSIVVR